MAKSLFLTLVHLALDKQLVVFLFLFFLFVYDVKRTIFGCTSSAVEFYLSGRSQ